MKKKKTKDIPPSVRNIGNSHKTLENEEKW